MIELKEGKGIIKSERGRKILVMMIVIIIYYMFIMSY